MAGADGVKLVEAAGYAYAFSREDMSFRPLVPLGRRSSSVTGSLWPGSETATGSGGSTAAAPRLPLLSDPRPPIDRLTLAVSNACNLACSYCYAARGRYYCDSDLLMSPLTARDALDWAAARFSHIGHINFFGGEPTLNCGVIDLTCRYAASLQARGRLACLPSFGITTNGYQLGEEAMRTLQRYGVSVTLSLDGPKEIHDRHRRSRTGEGSFDAVVANAHRLIAAGRPVTFECTYTADHHRAGVRIVELMDFFHREFGCGTLHCQFAAVKSDSPQYLTLAECRALMGEAIEYSVLNLARGRILAVSVAARLIRALANRLPIGNYCPAGRRELTVNADGALYPCFMLMQSPVSSFGRVRAPEEGGPSAPVRHQNTGTGAQVIEVLLEESDKFQNPFCRQCWARPLCFGCVGEEFERFGPRIVRSHVPGISELCDYRRGLVERFLHSVALVHLATTAGHESAGDEGT